MDNIVPLLKAQQGPGVKEHVSVANNACWAIGEVAVKVDANFFHKLNDAQIFSKAYISLSVNIHYQVRQEISPIVMNVITFLVPILSNTEV
jgi:hypothetical protein